MVDSSHQSAVLGHEQLAYQLGELLRKGFSQGYSSYFLGSHLFQGHFREVGGDSVETPGSSSDCGHSQALGGDGAACVAECLTCVHVHPREGCW